MELNAKLKSQQELYSLEIDGLNSALLEKANVIHEKEETIQHLKNQSDDERKNLLNQLNDSKSSMQERIDKQEASLNELKKSIKAERQDFIERNNSMDIEKNRLIKEKNDILKKLEDTSKMLDNVSKRLDMPPGAKRETISTLTVQKEKPDSKPTSESKVSILKNF